MDLTASLRVVYPSLTLSKRFSHRCSTIWTATAVRKRNQWRAAAIRLYCLGTSGIWLLCAAGAIDGTLQLINLLWRAGLKFAMHASVAWSAQADVTVRLPDAPSECWHGWMTHRSTITSTDTCNMPWLVIEYADGFTGQMSDQMQPVRPTATMANILDPCL